MIDFASANRMEQCALGSCILSEAVLDRFASRLQPEHFFNPIHKVIYGGMLDLHQEKKPSDIELLLHRMDKLGITEQCGGWQYLAELMDAVPSALNGDYYADRVMEQWALHEYRRLAELVDEPGQTLDALKIHADRIAAGVALKNAPDVIGRLGFFGGGVIKYGPPTGYRCLDKFLVSRGWPPGQMSIVSAYHKVGKTTFQLSCAIEAAKSGRRPLYATFADMGGADLESRAMKSLTGRVTPPGDIYELETWDATLRAFREDWWIDVYDASGLETGHDVETFTAWLEANHAAQGYTEVFVDYAQELHSRDKKAAYSELAEASTCASQIQRVARRTGLPIIVGSQITEGRNGERDKTKGSRAWEEKAGLVIRLQRDDSDPTKASMEVPYNRFGPRTQKDQPEPLIWNERHVRFDEILTQSQAKAA